MRVVEQLLNCFNNGCIRVHRFSHCLARGSESPHVRCIQPSYRDNDHGQFFQVSRSSGDRTFESPEAVNLNCILNIHPRKQPYWLLANLPELRLYCSGETAQARPPPTATQVFRRKNNPFDDGTMQLRLSSFIQLTVFSPDPEAMLVIMDESPSTVHCVDGSSPTAHFGYEHHAWLNECSRLSRYTQHALFPRVGEASDCSAVWLCIQDPAYRVSHLRVFPHNLNPTPRVCDENVAPAPPCSKMWLHN